MGGRGARLPIRRFCLWKTMSEAEGKAEGCVSVI